MKIDMHNGHATDADKIRIFFNDLTCNGVESIKIIISSAILPPRIQRKLIYIFRSLQ